MDDRATTTSALAEELAERAGRIRRRGWCEATSGNYSVVAGREPLRLWITPSGTDKGRLDADRMLLVDGRANPVGPGSGRPSAESALHVILARRPGVGAVLHTHSVWGTLLGEHFVSEGGFWLRGYEMLKALAGVTSHEEGVFVPILTNTQDMAALAVELPSCLARQPTARGFLIAGHGLYTWGEDLDTAYRHVEAFEFMFELAGRRVPLQPFTGE